LEVRLLKEERFENPQMVAGWPGMALLARMCVDYLILGLKAEPFAEICSRGNSVVVKDGLAEISSVRNTFYHHEQVIIFSGEEQPGLVDEVYRIADIVLEFAKRHKVERLYTVAAFPATFDSIPKVFGVANSAKLVDELQRLNIPVLSEGFVTGLNGVLVGVAKEKGIDAVCLLGQILRVNIPQPRTVKAVLDTLAKMIGIKLDTSGLEKEAEMMEESIRKEVERVHMERIRKETERYIS